MSQVSRRSLIAGSLGAGLALRAAADEQCGERPNTAPALQPPLLLTDWPWLARYRDDNARLLASGTRVQAVFMGDSITEGWVSKQADFFSNGIVGRGISAQTTPQMLVRMHADVVALKPRVVHIMAGTNDIAFNTGPMTAQDSKNNLMAMSEIARAHRIKVVLASIPPAARYPWRPGLETANAIVSLNEWIRTYAKQTGATYVDYHGAMSNGNGGMKAGLSSDEVHPTLEGYAVMRPLAQSAVK
ncbi:MAG: SGNH/GDSL hydrolase family protein [Pseudomonadota bacterium]